MDHAVAIASKATERYILGEMTGEEQTEFELHFFECQECADDVRATAIFVAAGVEVLRESVLL